MRKSWEFILLACALLTACAPSEADIETAVKQTQAVWTIVPSQTPYPTYTPYPTLEPLPTPSSTLPPDSSGMASIPAGEFLMGCDPSGSAAPCLDGESPPHLLYLEEYYIDLTEISITQYNRPLKK